MILLDSSVIIAAFKHEESHYKEALQIFEYGQNFILIDHVLFEVGTVLKMREGLEVSQNCIDFLLNTEGIEFTKATEEETEETIIEFQKEENKKLSFVDTLLLIIMNTRKIPLATFDKDLQKRVGK